MRHQPVHFLVQFGELSLRQLMVRLDYFMQPRQRRFVRVDTVQDVVLPVAQALVFFFFPL